MDSTVVGLLVLLLVAGILVPIAAIQHVYVWSFVLDAVSTAQTLLERAQRERGGD